MGGFQTLFIDFNFNPLRAAFCFSLMVCHNLALSRFNECQFSNIKEEYLPMNSVWIIGGGKFGLHALKGLSKSPQIKSFVIVDPVKPNFASTMQLGQRVDFVQMDGITFLNENLKLDSCPDWIIPALPVHLAARWCQALLGRKIIIPIKLPHEIDSALPNPMRGAGGDIYVSHANFLCPLNCEEPDHICTVTRAPRKEDMYSILSRLNFKCLHSIVIQSRQLGAGIGGYSATTLFQLLERINAIKGEFMVSTACRCHGVVTGFKKLSNL